MAKKKNITSNDIISFYMDYVLENNQHPNSVYRFAKHNGFEESKFYEYYSSFQAIEKAIFKTFHNNTITVLNASKDYENFEPRNKLLSYYFTFFETLTANRSYVIYALNKHKSKMKSFLALKELKIVFGNFIEELGIELIDIKQADIEKLQNKGLKESAWFQLLLIIKFWMDDTSPSFEKTDIFIEKSINTSFDVIDVAPIKSIIDLGKFIYKEKL